jgi:hypothetical protein
VAFCAGPDCHTLYCCLQLAALVVAVELHPDTTIAPVSATVINTEPKTILACMIVILPLRDRLSVDYIAGS